MSIRIIDPKTAGINSTTHDDIEEGHKEKSKEEGLMTKSAEATSEHIDSYKQMVLISEKIQAVSTTTYNFN